MINVDGKPVPLGPEDVTIVRSFAEGWAGAADGNTVVLLDKRITPQLKNEGLARDIVRNVQNLRKEAGLDIADRITAIMSPAKPWRSISPRTRWTENPRGRSSRFTGNP